MELQLAQGKMIASKMHTDNTIKEIIVDVKKLMNIAGMHGGHLRELFATIGTCATKAELLAAVTSMKNSFQHLRDSSCLKGYDPELEFESDKRKAKEESKRYDNILNVISAQTKTIQTVKNDASSSSKLISALEKQFNDLYNDKIDKDLNSLEMEQTIRHQNMRIEKLESEVAESRKDREFMSAQLENLSKLLMQSQSPHLQSQSGVVNVSIPSFTQVKAAPTRAPGSLQPITDESDEEISPPSSPHKRTADKNTSVQQQAHQQEQANANMRVLDELSSIRATNILLEQQVREVQRELQHHQGHLHLEANSSQHERLTKITLQSNAKTTSTSTATATATADIDIDVTDTSAACIGTNNNATTNTVANEVAEGAIEETEGGESADVALTRALSELLGTAHKAESLPHATATAEVSKDAALSAANLEQVTNATMATMSTQLQSLEERLNNTGNKRTQAYKAGFKKLFEELKNMNIKLNTSTMRVETVHDAMEQLDKEHSALLLAHKSSMRKNEKQQAVYFSAVDHIVNVVDILQAGLQRQEGLCVDMGKKMAKFLTSKSHIAASVVESSANNNNIIEQSRLMDPVASTIISREYGEQPDMPGGVSLLARMRIPGGNRMENHEFSMNQDKIATDYDAILAPDTVVEDAIHNVLCGNSTINTNNSSNGTQGQKQNQKPEPPKAPKNGSKVGGKSNGRPGASSIRCSVVK